jgi:hypothetical protein
MVASLVFVSALLMASTASTQMPDSVRAAAQAYRQAIAALEAHRNGQRVEPAFNALTKVRASLMMVGADKRTVLESLSDDEFARLEHELPGVLMNREETVFVEADPDFFVQLAVGHGDAVDREFFAALKATYPESVWPVYVEQQTDYSGCTRYGSGTLVKTFRTWSQFQARFPRRYIAAVQGEVERISEALIGSTCACGNRASIEQELTQFLQTYRAARLAGAVAARLQAIQAGTTEIRVNCQSG